MSSKRSWTSSRDGYPMANFFLCGKQLNDPDKELILELPEIRSFKECNGKRRELSLKAHQLINEAVRLNSHPRVKHEHDSHQGLSEILSQHPFPLSQGPVNLPLDCEATEKSEIEVLSSKTLFFHSELQGCHEWTPLKCGISFLGDIWNSPKGHIQRDTLHVSDSKFTIQGASSSYSKGNIIYTCKKEQCIINCPCSICNENIDSCAMQCREKNCKACSTQCSQHELKLPQIFNSKTDHYTIVTNKINMFQYATPYAGIPLNCDSCSNDVLEHQILHLVIHLKCRFCRQEFRPFENNPILTITDFVLADIEIVKTNNNTCKYCLLLLGNEKVRKRHEAYSHHEKEKKHKCDQCNLSYLNKSNLQYHTKLKHIGVKYTCEICGKQLSSEKYLSTHKRLIHSERSKQENIKCETCGKQFSFKQNLVRHERDVHNEFYVNIDYAKDDDILFRCEHCSELFKRKSNLERHRITQHCPTELEKKYECSACLTEFTRKDNLTRHVKKNNCD